MSTKEIVCTNIELECACRIRRTLFLDCRGDDKSSPAQILDSEKPLLIAFHGGAGQPEQMEKLTGFMEMGSENDFFVAYPEGVNRHWNDGRDLPRRREIDDVEFLVKLVDHLRQSFPVDTKRVYACGISNGGFFTQYLAARAPGIFAAVASVAATVHEPMYKGVKPVEPVPIMFVVGKDDPVVPFCGGEIELASRKAGRVVAAEQSFEYWVAANDAELRFIETELPVLREDDPTRVLKRVYPAGENGKPVVACIVEGGGHAWPKGWQYYRERYIGKTSQQLDTSRAVVEFCFQNSRSD
ncbi:MAG: prolyl oligopeptidase family serine peptidase [Candidatus Melainabacteria bacterium]|nr:prolyl oligopeptidase family serine peptidase [Candidatus Melainabacteria bacterium]